MVLFSVQTHGSSYSYVEALELLTPPTRTAAAPFGTSERTNGESRFTLARARPHSLSASRGHAPWRTTPAVSSSARSHHRSAPPDRSRTQFGSRPRPLRACPAPRISPRRAQRTLAQTLTARASELRACACEASNHTHRDSNEDRPLNPAVAARAPSSEGGTARPLRAATGDESSNALRNRSRRNSSSTASPFPAAAFWTRQSTGVKASGIE